MRVKRIRKRARKRLRGLRRSLRGLKRRLCGRSRRLRACKRRKVRVSRVQALLELILKLRDSSNSRTRWMIWSRMCIQMKGSAVSSINMKMSMAMSQQVMKKATFTSSTGRSRARLWALAQAPALSTQVVIDHSDLVSAHLAPQIIARLLRPTRTSRKKTMRAADFSDVCSQPIQY